MGLTLSWDIAIIVFFGIVMTYSFIIGKHESVKVIIGTYMSIIVVQSIGNILERIVGVQSTGVHILGLGADITVLSAMKIVLLLFFVVAFAIKSGIDVTYGKQTGTVLGILYTGLFGLTTAGLIVASLLTFATNGGILDGHALPWNQLAPIANGSRMMLLLVLNQELWFSLPAILILATGFLHND